MFNRSKTDLEIAIDEATTRVLTSDSETERKTHLETLERLHALKNETRSKPVSRDALIAAGTNLLGIAIIVGHERGHVVASKALNFVKKLV